jgi:hypothetical protein
MSDCTKRNVGDGEMARAVSYAAHSEPRLLPTGPRIGSSGDVVSQLAVRPGQDPCRRAVSPRANSCGQQMAPRLGPEGSRFGGSSVS